MPVPEEIENGVVYTRKGVGDHRFSKGIVGARSEPRFPHGDLSLWRFSPDGQRYTLYLTRSEAEDLMDALDALLERMDEDVR
jgi:hypothetical protein